MENSRFLPYYHPTTVAYVDDDRSFLSIFPVRVGVAPYLCFDNPHELLTAFSAGRLSASMDLRCWINYTGEVGDPYTEEVLGLDKWMIYLRLFNPRRFEAVSVVVIDYQMPEMSGLDLCRELAPLPCKKILLTSREDRTLAVHAFNEGLIDTFLVKSQMNLENELAGAIRRLQVMYFREVTAMIAGFLLQDDPQLWGDVSFLRLFNQLCADRGVEEYYAVSDPTGLLLVYRDGNADLLLMYTDEEIDAHCYTAGRLGAPTGVVVQMQSRRALPYIGDDVGNTVLTEEQWWHACIPLLPMPGQQGRYYALASGPAPFAVSSDSILSFERYLANAE